MTPPADNQPTALVTQAIPQVKVHGFNVSDARFWGLHVVFLFLLLLGLALIVLGQSNISNKEEGP